MKPSSLGVTEADQLGALFEAVEKGCACSRPSCLAAAIGFSAIKNEYDSGTSEKDKWRHLSRLAGLVRARS